MSKKEDITKKQKCRYFDNCTLTGDMDHKKEYYHLCSKAEYCNSKDDEIHMNRFVHPCPKKNCKDESVKHRVMYSHYKTDYIYGFIPKSTIENYEIKNKREKIEFITEPFKMIVKNDSNNISGIRICSYNILADRFTSPSRYEYCKKFISWDFRKELLSNNIDRLDADILCLQEVEEKSYYEVLQKKSNYRTIISNDHTLAILIKNDIKLVKEYEETDLGEKKKFLFVLIQLENYEMIIGNCHLLGDPKKKLEQKLQAERVLSTCQKLKKYPVIVCGDFNAKPISETYNVFSKSNFFKSSQKEYLKSDEPPFTFFTDQIKETMDYIWVTEHFNCIGTLNIWNDVGSPIPSTTISSDHLPIGSLLFIKGDKTDIKTLMKQEKKDDEGMNKDEKKKFMFKRGDKNIDYMDLVEHKSRENEAKPAEFTPQEHSNGNSSSKFSFQEDELDENIDEKKGTKSPTNTLKRIDSRDRIDDVSYEEIQKVLFFLEKKSFIDTSKVSDILKELLKEKTEK